jgi:hypothetical protein
MYTGVLATSFMMLIPVLDVLVHLSKCRHLTSGSLHRISRYKRQCAVWSTSPKRAGPYVTKAVLMPGSVCRASHSGCAIGLPGVAHKLWYVRR